MIVSHGFGSGFSSEFIWSGLRDYRCFFQHERHPISYFCSTYSPFLALHTVLDFWLHIGPDVIRTQIHSLARQAAKMLAGMHTYCIIFHTEFHSLYIRRALGHRLAGARGNVWIDGAGASAAASGKTQAGIHIINFTPLSKNDTRTDQEKTYDEAESVQNFLFFNYNIEVPIKACKQYHLATKLINAEQNIQSSLYVRISAHVYNGMEDYERLAKAILIWAKNDKPAVSQ